jgi:hypothetical protein
MKSHNRQRLKSLNMQKVGMDLDIWQIKALGTVKKIISDAVADKKKSYKDSFDQSTLNPPHFIQLPRLEKNGSVKNLVPFLNQSTLPFLQLVKNLAKTSFIFLKI